MQRTMLFVCFTIVLLSVLDDVTTADVQEEEEDTLFDDARLSGEVSKNEDPYDGFAGIMRQTKDVGRTSTNELISTGAKIGAAVGGLTINIASQGLKRTRKFLNSFRNKLKSGLNRMRTFNNAAINIIDNAVTDTSNYTVTRFGYLKNFFKSITWSSMKDLADQTKHTATGVEGITNGANTEYTAISVLSTNKNNYESGNEKEKARNPDKIKIDVPEVESSVLGTHDKDGTTVYGVYSPVANAVKTDDSAVKIASPELSGRRELSSSSSRQFDDVHERSDVSDAAPNADQIIADGGELDTSWNELFDF